MTAAGPAVNPHAIILALGGPCIPAAHTGPCGLLLLLLRCCCCCCCRVAHEEMSRQPRKAHTAHDVVQILCFYCS